MEKKYCLWLICLMQNKMQLRYAPATNAYLSVQTRDLEVAPLQQHVHVLRTDLQLLQEQVREGHGQVHCGEDGTQLASTLHKAPSPAVPLALHKAPCPAVPLALHKAPCPAVPLALHKLHALVLPS